MESHLAGRLGARTEYAKTYRVRSTRVAPDRLLLGYQSGVPGPAFARLAGCPRWPSTRMIQGPHYRLLQQFGECGTGEPSVESLRETPYVALAMSCIRLFGSYFGQSTLDGAVALAREYVRSYQRDTPYHHGSAEGSPPGSLVLVDKVADSDCFALADGHHRAAVAAAQGRHVLVRVGREDVRTPIQQMVLDMNQVTGHRYSLAQPIDLPELRSPWSVTRACSDRSAKMLDVLRREGLLRDAAASYLDVAASYGWFVKAMRDAGLRGEGLDVDPIAGRIAEIAYDLPSTSISVGEASAWLPDQGRRWDVVSCLSLLQDFVLGKAPASPEQLLRSLDQASRSVLFIDTAQEHEAAFSASLGGWNPPFLLDYLARNTSFTRILDLGPDDDGGRRSGGPFGRHLFACLRS